MPSTTVGEALTTSPVVKFHAGSRVITLPVLMPEAALVKLCFRSRPYIGQSWATATHGPRSEADASRVISTGFDGFIGAPPWENERRSGMSSLPGSPAAVARRGRRVGGIR